MTTQLIIRLRGEIQDSNFYEWRTGLIAQIKAADKVLQTDQDFIEADGLIKGFKVAEASLVDAKKTALAQAADITKLFDAIDDVSLQCRTTRLNLERQYRQRKEEIKDELIQAAAKQIQECISDQDEDYRRVSPAIYDVTDLHATIKGKRSIDSMELALDEYTYMIQGKIAKAALEIKVAAEIISDLPEDQAHLFHDRKVLLSMSAETLMATISSRLAAADAAEAKRKQREAEARVIAERQKADKAVEDARQEAIKAERDRLFKEADAALVKQEEEAAKNILESNLSTTPPVTTPAPTDEPAPVSNYVIRVYFSANKVRAEALVQRIADFVGNATVTLDTV